MSSKHPVITFGQGPVSIDDIGAIARGDASVQLSDDPMFEAQIEKGTAFLDRLLAEDGVIYGVTTGYGDSVTTPVPLHLVDELPMHLTRFHGCGLGDDFSPQQTRAILAARLASLTQGYSGVSWTLLQRLCDLLNMNILPRIPQEGSVGASGDLTPLSYVAAVLCGEREVWINGQLTQTATVFEKRGIAPLKLRPKEALAIMNGTAVMTGLACLAWSHAEYLTRLSSRITAMASLALQGNSNHFNEKLFSVKPHAGQQQVAGWIRTDINHHAFPRNSERLQDRYSIRCAPHVIGALRDALPWLRETIENELNSANDNPIVDGEGEQVLHGGHFYGGHIAMAMDLLKTQVANLADLHDRQMALLMDTKYNHGLPANLSASGGDRGTLNHGFKAVQIGCSAWTAEALKLTMPASVFSRSTECHNQDKVSMGTIAARDCLRISTLTDQVLAASLMAVQQGVRLRIASGELAQERLPDALGHMLDELSEQLALVEEDRPLEAELRALVQQIQQRHWPLYPEAV